MPKVKLILECIANPLGATDVNSTGVKSWLPESMFSTSIKGLMSITDNEVASELSKAAEEKENPGHNQHGSDGKDAGKKIAL